MKNFDAFLFVLMLCYSCNPSKSGNDKLVDSLTDTISKVQIEIDPKPFSQKVFVLPELQKSADNLEWGIQKGFSKEVIDGCGCLFSKDTVDQKLNKFLFQMNFDSIAALIINTKLTNLVLVQTNQAKDVFPSDSLHSIFTNGIYSLEIKARKIKKLGEEVWEYKGEAILRSSSKMIKKEITGHCGC